MKWLAADVPRFHSLSTKRPLKRRAKWNRARVISIGNTVATIFFDTHPDTVRPVRASEGRPVGSAQFAAFGTVETELHPTQFA